MAQCKNTLHLQPGWQSVADKISESQMARLFQHSSETPKINGGQHQLRSQRFHREADWSHLSH